MKLESITVTKLVMIRSNVTNLRPPKIDLRHRIEPSSA